jgi:hypothetical protein
VSALDQFNKLPIERRESILARAEELIHAERVRRSAPESTRNAAAVAACVLLGSVLGLLLLLTVVVL